MIKKELEVKQLKLDSSAETLLVKVKTIISKSKTTRLYKLCKPLLVLVFYRPPSSENNDLIPSLLEEVCHIAREHNAFLIVCGDLNMPHINWVDGTTTGGIADRLLLQSIADLNITQHIFKPTHIKGNILDVVLTDSHIVKSVTVNEPFLSDHSIIDIETEFESEKEMKTKKTIFVSQF